MLKLDGIGTGFSGGRTLSAPISAAGRPVSRASNRVRIGQQTRPWQAPMPQRVAVFTPFGPAAPVAMTARMVREVRS